MKIIDKIKNWYYNRLVKKSFEDMNFRHKLLGLNKKEKKK